MNQDSSRPFLKLAEAFAEKAAKDGTHGQKAPRPPHAQVRPPLAKSAVRPSGDDAESSLFLNAVSRIKPLTGKAEKRKQDATSLGDALAAGIRNDGTAGGEGNSEEGSSEEARDGDAGDTGALFSKAMRGVVPVNGKGRAVAAANGAGKPAPSYDPVKALREVLEGKVEFALHHTDEYMEGFVAGVDPLVLARLRAGQYSPEAHLDLHGMNAEQAHDALIWFVKDAYQKGLRTVVVVTGRGKNSPDGVGILRPMLPQWLSKEPFKRVVLAFCTARPHDGGPGSVYVLLRKYKKSRGKILWARTPSDDDFPDG